MAASSLAKEKTASALTGESGRGGCDDTALMARVRQRDHSAFACLAERHAGRYYRLAYRYLQHPQEAEDVVQQAFIRLWEQPGRWNPAKQARFTTWFYRVIVNACLDVRKGRRQEVEIAEIWPDTALLPDGRLQQQEEQQALERAIQALSERQQTALNLCFYEGLSNQEAAEVMGVRLKALQSLLMRAKATLKERMKAYL